MKMLKAKDRKNDIIFAAGILILAVFSFWRARYGADAYDEAFYLTIPYRMIKGDVLFLNEWHGSQLSAFLLYPFVRLYLALFKSTDGIIQWFRYTYTFVNAAVSCLAYSRLRRFGGSAVVGVLIYYLFVPYNISALSYNSMGYMFILLSSVFFATNFDGKKIIYLISGVFFACAVLCQPTLVAFFAIAFVAVIVYSAFKKDTEYLKIGGMFSVGCAIPALPVAAYLLIKIKISDIISSIGMITSDPEHDYTFAESLLNAFYSYYRKPYFIAVGCAFVAMLALALILKKKGKPIYFPIAATFAVGLFFIYRVYSDRNFSYINYLYFPLIFSGITAIIGIKDKSVKRYFTVSLVYSFIHLFSFVSSNQYAFVMTPAMMPAYIASVIVCDKYIEEIRATLKKSAVTAYKAVMAVSLCAVVALCAYYRYESVFSYSGQRTVKEMTSQINSGCYSGILSSEDVYNEIEKYKADFAKCGFSENDKVLILSKRTWLALENRGRLAQYSAWLSGIGENTLDRLNEYYRLNPDDKPEYVYICKDEAEAYNYDAQILTSGTGYKISESELAYLIKLK